MYSIKRASLTFGLFFLFFAIMLGCSHQQNAPSTNSDQQFIPSTNPDMYASAVIDFKDIHEEIKLSNLLGPTSFPSGKGLRDVRLGGGWVSVDMGKHKEIIDKPGPDLRVYESDHNFYSEWKADLYDVYVSNDNIRWHFLGGGVGIKEFDLAKIKLKEARYVKIRGFALSKSPKAGPEIESIESLHSRNIEQVKAAAVLGEKDEPAETPIPLNGNLDLKFGNYFALVIGNNKYQFLPRLKTAINDARAVTEILINKYGFKVEMLYNATREDILRALNLFRRNLNVDDNLLIYYAGHGWLDEVGDEGYWLPVDAEKDIETNWISNSHVTTTLRAMAAKHVIVVADSCYSGKLTRGVNIKDRSSGYLERIVRKKSRTVLSSGGLEPVLDSGGKGNHSVFASSFIDALTENNGIVDATQIFSKIRRNVMLNSYQTPEYADIRYAGHDGGDFLFVPFKSIE